ncbi:DUF2061 domain-containing protein [Aliidiomarina haloalkalitolerans]|uniref:DUF2061 domain-containing protein n=1 Tax=Aliidiomarina haloalkalitolerans TaxID=859059 RepID=A0A432VRD8_9GAMM|nr:DUF2061 domain-containing protein [Aliidiomarina haloalkalitolerans]RUO18882.1 hypothetical protein CWE06_09825 [Aliidiomarina haloalkalitolerans]
MKKTMTFAVVHFTVAFTVTYLLTGSWVLGGLIALIEPAVNTVAYFFHEKAWAYFGNKPSGGSKCPTEQASDDVLKVLSV